MEKWGFRFGKLVAKVKPEDRIKSWRIFTGDLIQVIAGPYEGERGKVLDVLRTRNQVIVEGINVIRRRNGQESIFVEQGIHASKVALLDPIKKEPTKVNWRFVEDGKGGFRKTRISKLSGVEIPRVIPPPRERKMGPKDTSPEDAHRVTFIPSLKESPIPRDCIL